MNAPVKNVIVVGIDGSESALVAARWAAHEAHLRRAELHLETAYSVPTGYAGPGAMIPPDLYDAARDNARLVLDQARVAVLADEPDLVITTRSSMQSPYVALRDASTDVALTVVGSHGMGVVSETLLGSIAMRIATHGRSPVVVVRTDRHDPRPAAPVAPDAPVMVGIDGSGESEVALAFALDEASTRGVALLAVRTWDQAPFDGFLRVYPLEIDRSLIDAQERKLLDDQIQPWADKYPQVQITALVRRGHPAGALIRCATELKPALLVVGSRGRGGFKGLLLGSTSHELIAYSGSPVAVVRT
ncbi:nucleotide-binding universal stress UspA family protein [Nakamurella sp. UYEF19]|uniref:universal stress protein n=1 Tax=Nakamurella sp. UYEF19 TaxID=1756392 RepID=UPI003390C1B0